MIAASKKQLFQLLTSAPKWYEGNDEYPAFCTKSKAAVMKTRHKQGILGDETYDSLAFHFGFTKETIYTKHETL